jgi:palmitoyltransferase
MKWERLLESLVNKAVYLLTLGIEAAILYRFYWSVPPRYYSQFDYYLQLVIIGIANPIIFVALWRATNEDCGRLLPDPNSSDKERPTCGKCNAPRINYTVHHCRRCNACIENMDHHCTFVGQCVGKSNMKYFLQFCLYIGLLLFYAILKMFWLFYTQNVERGVGVQGITWIYLPTPFIAPYVFYFSEADGGYPIFRTLDNFLFLICLAFCLFALTIMITVLSNLYKNKSEIDKLKKDTSPRPTRNTSEMAEIIYGLNPSFFDLVLPTSRRN